MKDFSFDALHQISCGKYFYQFYRSLSDYTKNIFPYFQAGLRQGDACLWLVSNRLSVDLVAKEASLHIEGFQEALESGQLTLLPAEDWYLENGHFHEVKAMHEFASFYASRKREHYPSVRCVDDFGAVQHFEWEKVHEYSQNMAALIRQMSVVYVCCYPIQESNLSDTQKLMNLHDGALVSQS